MDQQTIFLTILGMAAVTFVPRALPLLALAKRTLPESVIRWLSHVPAAVLAALLVPELLLREGRLDIGLDNFFFWAALPCFWVARRFGGMFAVVLTGMGLVAAARFFL